MTQVRTIGTVVASDFDDWQLFFEDIDGAPLTEPWEGHQRKQELDKSTTQTLAGVTTNGNTITLTADPETNAAFNDPDNPDRITPDDPLRYTPTAGAANKTLELTDVWRIETPDTVVRDLQFFVEENRSCIVFASGVGTTSAVERCILSGQNGGGVTGGNASNSPSITNCLIYRHGALGARLGRTQQRMAFVTGVHALSATIGQGIDSFGAGSQNQEQSNVAMLNCNTSYVRFQATGAGSHNASNDTTATLTAADQTTGIQTNVDATLVLENITDAANFDGRPVATESFARGGIPVAGITDDILRQPRDPTNPSLGCFEVVPPLAPGEYTIGTGQEFESWQLFFEEIPADITQGATQGKYTGKQVKEQLTAASTQLLTGVTADATNFVTITADDDAAFNSPSNPDRLTANTPLRYLGGNLAAAVIGAPGSAGIFSVTGVRFVTFRDMQIQNQSRGGSASCVRFAAGAADGRVERCILVAADAEVVGWTARGDSARAVLINNLAYPGNDDRYDSAPNMEVGRDGTFAFNTSSATISAPSTRGRAIDIWADNSVVSNNVGVAAQVTDWIQTQAPNAASSHNASGDATAIGVVTYHDIVLADEFEAIDPTTFADIDGRVKSGGVLARGGTPLVGEGLDVDILRQPRDPTNPTVGCFEVADVGPAPDPSATMGGTVVPTVLETEIIAGGQTVTLTLNDATWVPFTSAIRQDIIDGLRDIASAENDEQFALVRAALVPGDVSDPVGQVVTITLPETTGYNIIADGELQALIPASAYTVP